MLALIIAGMSLTQLPAPSRAELLVERQELVARRHLLEPQLKPNTQGKMLGGFAIGAGALSAISLVASVATWDHATHCGLFSGCSTDPNPSGTLLLAAGGLAVTALVSTIVWLVSNHLHDRDSERIETEIAGVNARLVSIDQVLVEAR